METAIDASFNNLWKIPKGELLLIMIISLIIFFTYYVIHNLKKKDDFIREQTDPLKNIIQSKNDEIVRLKTDIDQLKDINRQLDFRRAEAELNLRILENKDN